MFRFIYSTFIGIIALATGGISLLAKVFIANHFTKVNKKVKPTWRERNVTQSGLSFKKRPRKR